MKNILILLMTLFALGAEGQCILDTLVTETPETCEEGENILSIQGILDNSCPAGPVECNQVFSPTVWYQVNIDSVDANFLSTVVISDGFEPVWSVYYGPSFDNKILAVPDFPAGGEEEPCSYSDGDNNDFHLVPIIENTVAEPHTYWIGISAVDGNIENESFTLKYGTTLNCISCSGESPYDCDNGDFVVLVDGEESNGPFCPGQELNICAAFQYDASNTGNDWLHSIIPTFGNGWDLDFSTHRTSNVGGNFEWFEAEGGPCAPRLNGYDLPNICTYMEDGILKLCNTVCNPDCPCEGPLLDSSPIPSGWFSNSPGGSPTCSEDCSPASFFGVTGGITLDIDFCFDIKVRVDADPSLHDLTITLQTFSDAVTGCWEDFEPCLLDPSMVSPRWGIAKDETTIVPQIELSDEILCVGDIATILFESDTLTEFFTTDTAILKVVGDKIFGISPGKGIVYIKGGSLNCSYIPLLVNISDCDVPCSETNVNSLHISGISFVDFNENEIFDPEDFLLKNTFVDIQELGLSTLTDENGYYEFLVIKDSYNLTASNGMADWQDDNLIVENIPDTSACVEDVNFGFVPLSLDNNIEISLVATGVTRCDSEVKFYVHFTNTGFEPLTGTLNIEFDELTSYTGTLASNASLSGNVLRYTLEDLQPFQSNKIEFFLDMPSVQLPLPLLAFETSFVDTEGVLVGSDLLESELRCSYDPNDKISKPNRVGEEKYILPEEELEYTIRFQNNGNDTAFLVTLIDTLSEYINPRTVQVVGSSHTVRTDIEDQILTFTFEDILLVDSMTNYDESRGYVTFNCKTLADIPEFTIIYNEADIYFDANPPIRTNQVLNTYVEDFCFTVPESSEAVTICDGDSYSGYSESGVYPIEFITADGCDSLHTLTLTVELATEISESYTLCGDESININGIDYNEAGSYIDTIFTSQNCISQIFKIDIVEVEEYLNQQTVTICEGQEYMGNSMSGTYVDSLSSSSGCDSIEIVFLEVVSQSLSEQEISICSGESVLFNGINYSEAGEYQDTVIDANGCITLIYDITILVDDLITMEIEVAICEGQSYEGYTTSGTYNYLVESAASCDSVITLILDVLPLDDPDCIVATENELDQKSYHLYPVPAQDILYIDGLQGQVTLKVYDLKGRLLKSTYDTKSNRVDIKELVPGLYILAIRAADGSLSNKKFVKL